MICDKHYFGDINKKEFYVLSPFHFQNRLWEISRLITSYYGEDSEQFLINFSAMFGLQVLPPVTIGAISFKFH